MKNTGISRKVDELGRVVIPIELRRNLGIVEGMSLEFHVDGESVVLNKKEKSCFVTGEVSDDNVELLDGRICLSRKGAHDLMNLIMTKGETKGWLGN